MERREFNLRVFDFKRLDELEMEIAQVTQVHTHQVQQLLYDLLLLQTRRVLLIPVILNILSQDLDEPLLSTIDGLVVV